MEGKDGDLLPDEYRAPFGEEMPCIESDDDHTRGIDRVLLGCASEG